MKLVQVLSVVFLAASLSGAAQAEIVEIPAMSPDAKVFSLFAVKDPRRITPARATSELLRILAPLPNRYPCVLREDRGAAVVCAFGGVTISSQHLYSYNLNLLNFQNVRNELRDLDPRRFKDVRLPTGVSQVWGVNFVPPPTDGSPCVGTCNQVGAITLDFTAPVVEFGMQIDAGATVHLVEQLRISINGRSLLKATPVGVTELKLQDVDPETLAILPIQSVVIEPIGGATSAFVVDHLAFTAAR